MRLLAGALSLALLTVSVEAHADPDGGLAVLAGGASSVLGFIVGGGLLAARHSDAMNNAGWLTMEGGMTVAPLAAHAVVGEWGRGALFTLVPAGCLAGTGALFGAVPITIDQGTLAQQRLMWALFVVGQAASVAGVIDAAFAPLRSRRVTVTPTVGVGRVGLALGGVF